MGAGGGEPSAEEGSDRLRPKDEQAMADSKGDDDAAVGEWRQVENIITIARTPGGELEMIADSAQPSLELRRDSKICGWQAWRPETGELIYTLSLGSKDTLEVRKGERVCKLFRLARSKSILGDWVLHAGKSLSVVAGGRSLEMRGEGRPVLRLVRRRITEWDVQRERGSRRDSVYFIDHTEGSDSVTIRRGDGPEGSWPPLELTRAGSGTPMPPPPPAAPPAVELQDGFPRQRESRGLRSLCSRGRSRSPSKGPRRRSVSRGRWIGSHEAELEEFCSTNALSDRIVGMLRDLGRREQRHIMGLDGGRNSFALSGNVRDPDAVVMSRIKRLEQDPLPDHSPRELAAHSRSRSRWQRRSGSSCSSASSELGR